VSGDRQIEGENPYCGYTLRRARFACMNLHKMYFAALFISSPPVYSGKYFSKGTYDASVVAESCDNGASYFREFALEDVDFIEEQNDRRP
jgi:hypothetical protein